ncbi:MAG: endolytic transglycosylase MltG [Leadbetterella sp.]
MFKDRKKLGFWLIGVSTVVATLSFYFWQVNYSPNLNVDGKDTKVLYIPKNASFEQVMDSLEHLKVINDHTSWGFLTKQMGYREHVKPGRYEIPPNYSNRKLISKLRSGDQDPVKLTFNNIRTKADLAEKVGKKLLLNKKEILDKLEDPQICEKYGFQPETMMCMFLPDTYEIYWDVTADDFLDRMQKEYKSFWNDDRIEDAKEIGMTPEQVATLAAIVQSETNKEDEMPRVAGAYINRLNTNMALQADPTVKFAVGDFSLRRILNKHLAIDSPYNTYKNPGLPPGPIALPERVAIKSVLNYEKHNFVYFCAKEDFSGYHNFAATYEEHQQNARTYQNALNQRGIK